MRRHNRKVCKQGEVLAAAEAQKRGYRIPERNLYTPFGESNIPRKRSRPESSAGGARLFIRRRRTAIWLNSEQLGVMGGGAARDESVNLKRKTRPFER